MTQADDFKTWLETTTFYSPITINNYHCTIRRVLIHMPFEQWSVDLLNNYILTHNKEYFNTKSVRSAIVNFLKWQGKYDWIAQLIKVKNRGIKKPPSDVSYEQIKLLFNAFKDEVCQDIFIIQALTGCRQIEAWLIESANVQMRRHYVMILVRQKGGRNETIMSNKVHLLKHIFSKKRYRSKKYPFLNDECQKLSIEQIIKEHYGSIKQRYRRAWIAACDQANLPQYRSHDARRAVCRAVYAQAGIYAAQKVLRHRSIEMTSKYIEGMKIDIADVLEKATR